MIEHFHFQLISSLQAEIHSDCSKFILSKFKKMLVNESDVTLCQNLDLSVVKSWALDMATITSAASHVWPKTRRSKLAPQDRMTHIRLHFFVLRLTMSSLHNKRQQVNWISLSGLDHLTFMSISDYWRLTTFGWRWSPTTWPILNVNILSPDLIHSHLSRRKARRQKGFWNHQTMATPDSATVELQSFVIETFFFSFKNFFNCYCQKDLSLV